jgi:hypothetical protein
MSCIEVAPRARRATPAPAPCGGSLQPSHLPARRRWTWRRCKPCRVSLQTLAPAGVQALDLAAMGARHWRVAGCSAVTGEGLLGAFEWVVGDVQSRIYLLD